VRSKGRPVALQQGWIGKPATPLMNGFSTGSPK
jgi:hypothetical protein